MAIEDEMTELDAEKLVSNIETTGEANPEVKDDGSGEPKASSLTFDGPESLMSHKLEYTANGKKVSEDIATILKRASQGYNYAQLSHEQKERGKMLDDQSTSANQMQEKWSKFENFAKENPKWYDHWNTAWDQRDQISQGGEQQQAGGHDDSRLTAMLEQKLEPIRDFMTKQQAQGEQLQLREQDQALDQEMKETRAEFPSIDFDSSDAETGKTLQWQTLELANEKGMGFKDAFKVLYHDKLLVSRMEEEKAKWAKDQEASSKSGIIGTKSTSSKPSTGPDFKNSSWEQVAEYVAKQHNFS